MKRHQRDDKHQNIKENNNKKINDQNAKGGFSRVVVLIEVQLDPPEVHQKNRNKSLAQIREVHVGLREVQVGRKNQAEAEHRNQKKVEEQLLQDGVD